jgi:preprotein translocase subunit SecF
LIQENYIANTDEILDQAVTGPNVGSYMQSTALKALIRGIFFMAIYMLISFSGIRKYIKPEVLAIVTIIAMLFDISIPVGAYGFWMMINPTIQVDTIFIIAILTTMGYSINDTIIIFDRVRENMQRE